MDNLLNQKNQDIVLVAPGNSVNIEVPTINVDTNQENNGINDSNVEEATIYLSQLKLNNAPGEEQRQGEIYLTKLKQQAAENKSGTTLHHQMLRDSTIEVRENVDHINRYLFLDENGQPQETENVAFDFGNPALNQMYSLIRRDMNALTNRMDRKFGNMDRKFGNMDRKFSGMERLIMSERNKSKNKLLASGGDADSPNAYLPICNDLGQYPNDGGLEPLTSLDQINRMNGILTDQYLSFYRLGTTRLVSEKKARLMEYIGIHERIVVSLVRGASPV
ncbi:unnamed protein product [Debaryomyces tyrocola]|nr:unnamed protein product [Debaryomyces tyrocola]